MADWLYDGGRNRFARGEILWRAEGGSIVCAFLVDGSYGPDRRHEFLSDIPPEARRGNRGGMDRRDAPPLTLFEPVAGVCDAEDLPFVEVPAGPPLIHAVLFMDLGSDDESPLIAVVDSVRGFPYLSSEADVTVVWSNGPNRIFKL